MIKQELRTHLRSKKVRIRWVFAFSSKYTKRRIITKLFRIPYIGILTFALTGSPFAQQLLWQRVFDTGEPDGARAVAIDREDNVIVAGTTVPDLIDPNDHGDFLIVKYSPSGDTLWTQQYNRTQADNAYGVATDRSGNIIVAGRITTDSTSYDAHIVKFTPNGDTIWTRTFYGRWQEEADAAYAVAIDSKGNIIIAGEGHSTPSSYSDYLTVKYDSSGILLWARWYDNTWEDVGQDVAVDDSDNVIVTGYSNNEMNWDWCTIKYNPNGDTLWVRRYDVSLDDWAHGVATDKEGNIIVVGRVIIGTRSLATIVKYNRDGDTLWTKRFTNPLPYTDVTKLVDVKTDEQRNIYATGDYTKWDTTGKMWVDYYVAKCSPSGDMLWTTRYNTNVNDQVSGIALDGLKNIVITGTTEGLPDDPYRPINFYTVKLHNSIDGVSEDGLVPRCFYLHQNYPNPFNPVTEIRWQIADASQVSLKVFDVLGREVATLVNEVKPPGEYTVRWDASNQPSGVYVYQLVAGTFGGTKKMLLIR